MNSDERNLERAFTEGFNDGSTRRMRRVLDWIYQTNNISNLELQYDAGYGEGKDAYLSNILKRDISR